MIRGQSAHRPAKPRPLPHRQLSNHPRSCLPITIRKCRMRPYEEAGKEHRYGRYCNVGDLRAFEFRNQNSFSSLRCAGGMSDVSNHGFRLRMIVILISKDGAVVV